MPHDHDLGLFGLIERHARERPRAVAIEALGRAALDYRGLSTEVRRSGDALARLGCVRGDRVGILMANGPEMAVACLALAATVTCVPLNPAYTEGELRDLISRLRVRLLITTPGQMAARHAARALGVPVAEIRIDGSAPAGSFSLASALLDGAPLGRPTDAASLFLGGGDEHAMVLHTSGSTAEPKIVPLTHRNLLASAGNVARSLGLGPEDACLSAMPLFHIGALVDLLLAPLGAGGRVIVAESMDAGAFFRHVDGCAPTWYQGVPTMLQAILQRARAEGRGGPGSLRFIRSVSAPLPPALLAELEGTFAVPVIEIYGMTETAGVITSNPMPPGERRPGSVGVPVGPELRIVDTAGNAAPAGSRGEVRVRGESVFAGYEVPGGARGEGLANGWLRTGDEGYLDGDGYLYLTGRIKDIINRGGEKIAPREIDEVALAHPDVHEAAAFALPHDTLGEDVALAVVPAPGRRVDVEELRAHCAARLARFKVPRSVFILDALPRAPGGKLRRGRLAELCRAGEGARGATDSAAGDPSERERVILRAWEDVLGVHPLGVHDDFVDLGGDSLRAVDVALRLSERLGFEVPAAALYDHPTVARLAAALGDIERAAPPRARAELPPRPRTELPGRDVASSPEAARALATVRELVATWEGARASRDALVVGWNTLGSRPPLFFGVQGADELRRVAQGLGPDQPVYGMRSLYETGLKSVETLTALARRYRGEIERLRPEGTLHLGGYCGGAEIALMIARELRAAGREPTSLSLVEHYDAAGYEGPVSFYFGAESGWHPFKTVGAQWLSPYSGRVALHPSRAEHVSVLADRALLEAVAREVDEAERASMSTPEGSATLPPREAPPGAGASALDVAVALAEPFPRVLASRAEATLHVGLTNRGAFELPSRTAVFARWSRPGSERALFDAVGWLERPLRPDERARVPLRVRAPLSPGPWALRATVVVGGDWNAGWTESGPLHRLAVVPGRAAWDYLLRFVPRRTAHDLTPRRAAGDAT